MQIDLSDVKMGTSFRGERMIAICRVLKLTTDDHTFERACLWNNALHKNVDYVLIHRTEGGERISSVALSKINEALSKE